jgi:hypothetical protein
MTLKRLNLAAGIAHAAQAVVVVLISTDFSLPVTGAFLRLSSMESQLQPEIEVLFELRIGWLVAAFFALSAIAHFLNASVGSKTYLQNIARGLNPSRWIEYSLSASLMIVIIAMLVGIYDIVALVGLFGINAAMIGFGYMMEIHNQSTVATKWDAFWLGSLAGALPWIGVAIYLFATPGVPTFVYWVYASIFFFFNCFAVNMYMQYKRIGKWNEYAYGERVYMLLSLLAKSLLAWQVFAGTLRPQ